MASYNGSRNIYGSALLKEQAMNQERLYHSSINQSYLYHVMIRFI